MHPTLPQTPIPDETLTPEQIGRILDDAAALIDRDGLHVGDWWRHAGAVDWTPGRPCCAAGAIGVAAGYRRGRDIDGPITGLGARLIRTPRPHPAFAALMRHLDVTIAADVFDWADRSTRSGVADTLRETAAVVRAIAQLDRRAAGVPLPADAEPVARLIAAWDDHHTAQADPSC